MNSFYSAPDFMTDYSCWPGGQETHLPPTEESSSPLSGFGYSVQMLGSDDSGYINQQERRQEMPDPSCSLSDYSILHLSSIGDFVVFPKSVLAKDSDGIVPGYFFEAESVDDLECTDSTPTDQRQTAQAPKCLTTESLNKATPQPVATETVKFAAPESVVSSAPATLEKACVLATGDSSQANYAKSLRRRMTQAKYIGSVKGKKTRTQYSASARAKMSRANYVATERGLLSKLKCQAKYLSSTKGRMRRAISNARSGAYRTALKQGYCEELAREKGELAAKRRMIALNNQQASMAKNKIETPAAQVDFKVQYPVLNGTIKKMATILTVTEIQEFEIIVFGSKSSRMSEACCEFSCVLRAKEAFFQQYFLHFGIALGINLLLNIGIGFYPKHQEQISSLLSSMQPEYVELQS